MPRSNSQNEKMAEAGWTPTLLSSRAQDHTQEALGLEAWGGCLLTIRIEPRALPLAASLSRRSALALQAVHPSAVAGADLREDTVRTGASDRKRR